MWQLGTKSGVTLTEVLIYMALSAIIFIAISHIFIFSLHAWQSGSRRIEAQQAARMALDSMVRELREAVSLEYDPQKPHEITYIEPIMQKKVRFYEFSGFLYRDSDLVPQPVAGIATGLA
jgi:Tfp pilus assembly protein PilV